MNRVVVMRAAAGLAAHVKTHGGGAVVIGYDARHKSDVFAHDTAAVMAGAGLAAMVLPRPLPTPVLAFAIQHLGCAAGVMVTASHNPPRDNGYKVYLGTGSQIVPPVDAEISARIGAIGPLATVPRGDGWQTLGVAVPTGDGDYRMLRGDDVGVLLGVHLLRRGARGAFACSIVSSSLLGKVTADAGVPFVETLTGFKWIAQVPGLAYGYEEALGY